MMQRVNLYTRELRPKKERLQAFGAALALGCVLLLMVIYGVWLAFQQQQNAERIAAAEARNAQLEQTVADLSRAVRARQPNAELQAALQRLEQTIERRQRLLERVEGMVLTGGAQFSPRMSALARQIPDNVWLTGLAFDARNDHMAIQGRATSGDLVPVYLEQLGDAPEFAGRTFTVFRLERPESGRWIDFLVATQRDREDNP